MDWRGWEEGQKVGWSFGIRYWKEREMDALERYVGVKSARLGEELAVGWGVSSLRLAEWGGAGRTVRRQEAPEKAQTREVRRGV